MNIKGEIKINMIINIGAFAILALLWLGFAAALIFNQAILDTVWQTLYILPSQSVRRDASRNSPCRHKL